MTSELLFPILTVFPYKADDINEFTYVVFYNPETAVDIALVMSVVFVYGTRAVEINEFTSEAFYNPFNYDYKELIYPFILLIFVKLLLDRLFIVSINIYVSSTWYIDRKSVV